MVIPLITFATIKDWIEEIWQLYVVLNKTEKECLYTRVRSQRIDWTRWDWGEIRCYASVVPPESLSVLSPCPMFQPRLQGLLVDPAT